MVGKTAPVMRWGVPLLAGALLVAACSDSSSETTTPPTTSTTTSTTTSAPPTTTTTTTTTTTETPPTTVDPLARPDVLVSDFDRDSIDDFDTTGDDLYRVVMEHQDLFNYLEGNPSESTEAMVSLLFEPTYPYWDSLISDFDLLTSNPGWRYVDPGVETLGIAVLETSGDLATIRLADQRGLQLIADASGAVALEIPGWDKSVGTVTLRRGEDGRWRFLDLTPSEPLLAEEMESMVAVDWTGR